MNVRTRSVQAGGKIRAARLGAREKWSNPPKRYDLSGAGRLRRIKPDLLRFLLFLGHLQVFPVRVAFLTGFASLWAAIAALAGAILALRRSFFTTGLGTREGEAG